MQAGAKVGLKMNLPRCALEEVSAQLPALHTPSITNQTDPDWVALEVIIDEKIVRDLIPDSEAGGRHGHY